jgi:hypothetical protein
MAVKALVKLSLTSLLLLVSCNQLQAQKTDTLSQQFLMNVEIRPRAEYTSNYILPPNDSIDPYFYITQRNRISMHYAREKMADQS